MENSSNILKLSIATLMEQIKPAVSGKTYFENQEFII